MVTNLDELTGGPLDVRLGGNLMRLYSSFSCSDTHHYERLLDRELKEFVRQAAAQLALDEWKAADKAARRAGTPPPKPFDAAPFGRANPDFYPAEEYERDVTNLLTSVLRRSEWSKPEAERLDVDATVGRITLEQTRTLLAQLWQRKDTPRDPPAPPSPPDQVVTEASEPTPIRKPRKRKGATTTA